MDFTEMIPFLIPVALIQLSMQVYCIVDLVKREKVRFDNKLLWGAVIILFSIIGSAVYLVLGRTDK
jgi:hypothetical protein